MKISNIVKTLSGAVKEATKISFGVLKSWLPVIGGIIVAGTTAIIVLRLWWAGLMGPGIGALWIITGFVAGAATIVATIWIVVFMASIVFHDDNEETSK